MGYTQPLIDHSSDAPIQWLHTGGFRDYGAPRAVCELCGHTGLRYHFLIANRASGEVLWVGSKCIEQFQVAVSDAQGQLVEDVAGKGRALRGVMKDAVKKRILDSLDTVFEGADREVQSKIRWIAGKFNRRGGFSPKDLVTLFRLLDVNNIDYQPGIYPVTLRSKKDRTELLNLTPTELSMITDCLTTTQQEKYPQLFPQNAPTDGS